MIGIVDYGMGNVASLANALNRLGYSSVVTDQFSELKKATHIILPGVGSFQAAASEIDQRDLRESLIELAENKPFLGICLGMQLLFTTGNEGKLSRGLDLLPGTVEKLETTFILPHMGWNTLDIVGEKSIFAHFHRQSVYFVHSFGVKTAPENIVATAEYGVDIPAIVQQGNIFGMQFHPEKSGEVGLSLLRTFLQGGVNLCESYRQSI